MEDIIELVQKLHRQTVEQIGGQIVEVVTVISQGRGSQLIKDQTMDILFLREWQA